MERNSAKSYREQEKKKKKISEVLRNWKGGGEPKHERRNRRLRIHFSSKAPEQKRSCQKNSRRKRGWERGEEEGPTGGRKTLGDKRTVLSLKNFREEDGRVKTDHTRLQESSRIRAIGKRKPHHVGSTKERSRGKIAGTSGSQ